MKKDEKMSRIYSREHMNLLDYYFNTYGDKKYTGDTIDEAKRKAIKAYTKIVNEEHTDRFNITKDITVKVDYSSHKMRYKYEFEPEYSIVFILYIGNMEIGPITAVREDTIRGHYTIHCEEFVLSFNRAIIKYKGEEDDKGTDAGGVQASQGDMAHDEEEVREPEVQGLSPLRGSRNKGVQRVA